MRKFEFEKDPDNRWYVILPNYPGDRSDLEMVSGADELLDILSNYQTNRVKLDVSERILDREDYDVVIDNYKHDDPGDYVATIINNDSGDYSYLNIWLCPVLQFVYGYYPDTLYMKVTKRYTV